MHMLSIKIIESDLNSQGISMRLVRDSAVESGVVAMEEGEVRNRERKLLLL